MRFLTVAFALVLLVFRAQHYCDFGDLSSSFKPVGLGRLLTAPLPRWSVWGIWAFTVVSGVLAGAGWRFRYSGPLFACCFLWVTTYRNCFGMVFHTDNLVALHLLVLGVSPAGDGFRVCGLLRWGNMWNGETSWRYGWPLRALALVTVCTYVVAGAAKLRLSGWSWSGGEVIREHIAYDIVRKLSYGGLVSPFGTALVKQAWAFPLLATMTLGLELFAPLALLGRRWAFWWCWVAWGFHLGVLATMLIVFAYPLSGVAYACFFEPEKWFYWAQQRWRLSASVPDSV